MVFSEKIPSMMFSHYPVIPLSHYPIGKHRFLSSSPIFSTQPMLSHINHFSAPDSSASFLTWKPQVREGVGGNFAKARSKSSLARSSWPKAQGLQGFFSRFHEKKPYETVWNWRKSWDFIHVIFPDISGMKPRSFVNLCDISKYF